MNRHIAPAAAALFRALARRSGLSPASVLLTAVETAEWNSLTISGERHRLSLRLSGPGAAAAAHLLGDGLEDADLPLRPGLFVADIGLERPSAYAQDSVEMFVEALTVRE